MKKLAVSSPKGLPWNKKTVKSRVFKSSAHCKPELKIDKINDSVMKNANIQAF